MTLEQRLKQIKARCEAMPKGLMSMTMSPDDLVAFVVKSRQDIPMLVELVEYLRSRCHQSVEGLDFKMEADLMKIAEKYKDQQGKTKER